MLLAGIGLMGATPDAMTGFLGQYLAQPLKREAHRLETRLSGARMVGPFRRSGDGTQSLAQPCGSCPGSMSPLPGDERGIGPRSPRRRR